MQTGSVYALLIGINQYENRMMQGLRYAVRDVRALRELARERMALEDKNCTILTSPVSESGLAPGRMEFLSELDRFAKAPMQQEDVFILFFAGHGFAVGDSSYLMTSDANPGSDLLVKDTAVAFELLRAYCRRIKAGHQIIIMDACRNVVNKDARSVAAAMSTSMTRDIAALARDSSFTGVVGSSRAIISSCWEGQTSYEYQKAEQGWFCYNLLETLRHLPGPGIKVGDLIEQVRIRMEQNAWNLFPEAAAQRPHIVLDGEAVVLPLRKLPHQETVVAENPEQVVITEPEITPIHVAVNKVEVKQVSTGRLPLIPSDILELEGEAQGLQIAIQNLRNNTHISLAQGLAAVREADDQLRRLARDLAQNTPTFAQHGIAKFSDMTFGQLSKVFSAISSQSPDDSKDTNSRSAGRMRSLLQGVSKSLNEKRVGIPGTLSSKLAKRIKADPSCSASVLCDLAPNVNADILLPYIQRLKNHEKAQRVAIKARTNFDQAKETKIAELSARLKDLELKLKERKTEDLEMLLKIFQQEHAGAREFPLDAWIEFEKLLRPRRYPYTSREILKFVEEPFCSAASPEITSSEVSPPSTSSDQENTQPVEPKERQPRCRVNKNAWCSFLFFWIPVLGPFVAVICGHQALRQIRQGEGREIGLFIAKFGLLMGYLGLVLILIFIISANIH